MKHTIPVEFYTNDFIINEMKKATADKILKMSRIHTGSDHVWQACYIVDRIYRTQPISSRLLTMVMSDDYVQIIQEMIAARIITKNGKKYNLLATPLRLVEIKVPTSAVARIKIFNR